MALFVSENRSVSLYSNCSKMDIYRSYTRNGGSTRENAYRKTARWDLNTAVRRTAMIAPFWDVDDSSIVTKCNDSISYKVYYIILIEGLVHAHCLPPVNYLFRQLNEDLLLILKHWCFQSFRFIYTAKHYNWRGGRILCCMPVFAETLFWRPAHLNQTTKYKQRLL